MSGIPEGFQYTEEHEYVREAGAEGEFLIGITDYAQGELGDVVFVELPAPGGAFEKMEVFGTIEAVQAVSDLVDRTSTAIAPWTLVEADDKLFARIRVLRTFCERIEEKCD